MTTLVILGVIAMAEGQAASQPDGMVNVRAACVWAELLDRVGSDPGMESARAELIEKARKAADAPIIRRAHGLDEVGAHRTWLDGRTNALEPEIAETFALAMSDFGACNALAQELPLLASAYRLTGDAALLDRVTAQLEEMAAWSPLQRPGWTLFAPGNRLPADGQDGNWLATGTGIRAIANTLELLPEDALAESLRQRLRQLLESEIAGVVDDWETKRPWFVSSDNPITNQWVLPTEGLVRACLVVGADTHRDAYELGVRNLIKALDAHGAHGEFEEGFGYASFTVTSMLHAARAMAVEGDRRAIDHPFLKNFPLWLVHHIQPGRMIVNCFDAGGAYDAAQRTEPLLTLLAACMGSPVARWALAHQVDQRSTDLPSLAAQALPAADAEAAPPLYAYYERATRVNWRDTWDDNGTGVWIRGGHELDQHDHQDRGHVNFISRGRPILIEAGTPSYHHELMPTHYSSGVGHNVLQLGTEFPSAPGQPGKVAEFRGWQKRGGVAPITVNRLDADGGEVAVNGTACYDGLIKWARAVSWSADEMVVTDDVALSGDAPEVVVFRWHLGTEQEASISETTGGYAVTWPGAVLEVTSGAPLLVTQTRLPDHTLAGHDGSEDPKNGHTCIVVQTRDSTASALLCTRITPSP